ncbi:hypothetical protein BpHYR1_048866 [Brachionus plicatilis]|uniref:Uncharacterized protein n=1 Tax=Brachionus plicatilis TaxID=10195 RepID=A0A3M7PGL0_BRAPC|nr:hypothetical protein BpHYR1_048866 [Brachionus plicatilis]
MYFNIFSITNPKTLIIQIFSNFYLNISHFTFQIFTVINDIICSQKNLLCPNFSQTIPVMVTENEICQQAKK